MRLYIYTSEGKSHIATIIGTNNAACEAKANEVYGSNEFGWTYTPAFGASDGLVESDEAEIIEA